MCGRFRTCASGLWPAGSHQRSQPPEDPSAALSLPEASAERHHPSAFPTQWQCIYIVQGSASPAACVVMRRSICPGTLFLHAEHMEWVLTG